VPEPSLHHAGYVVPSIAGRLEEWRVSLSAISISEAFEDKIQRARVAFLDLPPAGALKIELVEPLGPDSPVASFLEKGGGLHHLCFEVDDLDAQIRFMKANKAVLIRRPQPALAFSGRLIAWMLTREKLLVEYLERAPRASRSDHVR
jgi:methylmalonyl-CoA/ethylmalonyl-CoA epimerase